jgi:hypothetical protein
VGLAWKGRDIADAITQAGNTSKPIMEKRTAFLSLAEPDLLGVVFDISMLLSLQPILSRSRQSLFVVTYVFVP